ncbi:unnamed protein product [Prorocentrum cordatum]|uniref:Uncharacterized protein n=1 Tax=Prorocentrum cordatum TaxID=2364126 RepID=A0ABN9V1W0_9DINO|nr:unnamed protein product [Polarella glacialis]
MPRHARSPCGSGRPGEALCARRRAQYEQWGDIGKQGRSLSGRVRLLPAWRQVFADAGSPQEAEAFQFHIRGDGAEHGATLEAAQAAHQALNIRASGLRSLGFEHLGGLLGTEEHDRSLEQLADACKAFRARSRQSKQARVAGGLVHGRFLGHAQLNLDAGASMPTSPVSSSMTASWDATN